MWPESRNVAIKVVKARIQKSAKYFRHLYFLVIYIYIPLPPTPPLGQKRRGPLYQVNAALIR